MKFTQTQKLARRTVFASFALIAASAHAQTAVSAADLKGLTDPSGIRRYAGAVLVYRDDVAYDELSCTSSATPTTGVVLGRTSH